jgi:hypothetical protein
MLVMPVSESAAAGDSELSSIFQPVMSTARKDGLSSAQEASKPPAPSAKAPFKRILRESMFGP